MAQRPLLALVMIVKDEAVSIQATVASVKPFVDWYLLLDTGSTDGTQELARQAFGDVPGRIVEEPFVNYGATRTRALELVDGDATFALMLSGDETLRGGEALRAFCEAHRDATGEGHGAYHLEMEWGHLRFPLPRLTRGGAGFVYAGVTHETLAHPTAPFPWRRVPGASIVHDVEHRDVERKRRSWLRDLELLRAECDRHPEDTRAAFYLAQTLEDLGRNAEASEAYRARARMGGFEEEVFQALFRGGRAALAAGLPWSEVQERWHAAHAHSPERAEPLYALAHHWFHGLKQPAVAYLYASRAAQLPEPRDVGLPVEADLYPFRRFLLLAEVALEVREWEVGVAAVRRALAAQPDDGDARRLLGRYHAHARPPSRRERCLVAMPVGASGKSNLERLIRAFGHEDFDYRLLVYDDEPFDEPLFAPCHITRDRGGPFELARRHLLPERCRGYRFVFFWMDDVDVTGFDVHRFLRVVEHNQLELAQPALTRGSEISHLLTLQKEGSVGRFTDFVQGIAPVFTGEAWARFWPLLEEGNFSGWGYDMLARGYCGFQRMGIVDCEAVTHLQRQSHLREESRREYDALIARHPDVAVSELRELGALEAPPGEGERLATQST